MPHAHPPHAATGTWKANTLCASCQCRYNTHMAKRAHDEDAGSEEPVPKRRRTSSTDRLSSLSDELLLKVLALFSVSQLVVCQR